MKQPSYTRGKYNITKEKKIQFRYQIFEHEKEKILNFIKELRNGTNG